MGFTVLVKPRSSEDVICEQEFYDYDEANEFAETWAMNGFECRMKGRCEGYED